MDTGENERSLRPTIDMVRTGGFVVLLLHFYFYSYGAFRNWGYVSVFSDRVLENLTRTGLFKSFYASKLVALFLLTIATLGVKGRKTSRISYAAPLGILLSGMLLYFGSALFFYSTLDENATAIAYMASTLAGYCCIMTGGSLLTRVLRTRLYKDVFNTYNETFPQEQRKIKTDSSINLPYRFSYRGKTTTGWINLNMVRGLLLAASSGSGKTWYIIQHIIRQQMANGYAMFIYDYKYDDLTSLAYNCFLQYRSVYPVQPRFYALNFEDLSRTHQCNALATESMTQIADAAESARSFLLGLNPDWIQKQGDFWVESSIAFLTALIWYLRRHEDGKYCTLAHVIELSQVEYHRLFSILRAGAPEIQNYLNPFLTAYLDKNKETVGNQMVSLKIGMARLSSPAIYYVVSGNDFTLDVNNPASPKIVCMGNSPQRSGIYGAVISLYVSTLNRLVARKGMINCGEIFDEAPTISNHQVPQVLATGRSYGICVTLCIQSLSQMRAIYGRDQADMLFELPANKIFGQQTGDSARHVSDLIGRVMQERQSIQTNRNDTSVSQSAQLESAVPVSRIAKLSAGEFVGLVADDPDNLVELKAFHGHIIQDNKALAKAQAAFVPLPVVRAVTEEEVLNNFIRIRDEISLMVDMELSRMMETASLAGLVIAKNGG